LVTHEPSDLETLKTTIPITTENQDILTSESGERLVLEQEELSIVEKKGRRKKGRDILHT